jgi:hypothetical protein
VCWVHGRSGWSLDCGVGDKEVALKIIVLNDLCRWMNSFWLSLWSQSPRTDLKTCPPPLRFQNPSLARFIQPGWVDSPTIQRKSLLRVASNRSCHRLLTWQKHPPLPVSTHCFLPPHPSYTFTLGSVLNMTSDGLQQFHPFSSENVIQLKFCEEKPIA